jgi:hypothetical protein
MTTERLVDRPERTFQLWAYTVGMKRLLLRSTKNETFTTRIDILFQNVKAVQLPTSLDGLVVTAADDELSKRIEGDTGILAEDSRFFAIETAGRLGYVVAGVMVSKEDEGEYFEPSELWPDLP